ncbi:hypothetical protein G7Y79_00017g043220 [Physcia stellaris]|nr:hypothetical protein G7Y79_00017g043220 [Physcia stellaris]
MQRPDATEPIDINSPLPASTNNAPMPKQKQDATAWETCLAESKDTTRYPRVPVIDGPFQGFEEMLDAKEHGNYNVVNPFHRPTGPTQEHITLLQNLYAKGKSIDDIAAFLVVTYPHLMEGWKDGTEYDRRVQIHGLVNLWVSCWAPRFGGDGRVGGGEGRGG